MPSKKAPEPFVVVDSLIAAFSTNNRLNEYLLKAVPDAAWRAEPPNGKGRTIAAIFSHMHNVRGMWLKVAAKGTEIPEKLERDKCTKAEVEEALDQSWRALETVLQQSLSSDGRIKGFKPDAGGFLGYLLAHDAHHRGQISMLARQVGHPISQAAMFGMWEWGVR
jgi:uncharacterized damage-inducible protein DinB